MASERPPPDVCRRALCSIERATVLVARSKESVRTSIDLLLTAELLYSIRPRHRLYARLTEPAPSEP